MYLKVPIVFPSAVCISVQEAVQLTVTIMLRILNLLSAILYKMKLGQSVTTIPTVGFNVETVTFQKVKFNVWVSIESIGKHLAVTSPTPY